MVGSLMYLTATRPDLMYVVCLVSRYMEKPTELHLLAVKRIFRYLNGTIDLGILYNRKGNEDLVAFTDSDYAGDFDDRRSTSGYVFLLGTGSIAWSSKKQAVVSLSTTEAEFIAAAMCACQCIWLRRILDNLGSSQSHCSKIFCDNSSAIKLSKNPVLHGRSKHIDVRYHFLRDLVQDGKIELEHCSTDEQVSDIMTKPLKVDSFVRLRRKLGMCSCDQLKLNCLT
ncbi:secreted RxLR effector protein 161-like [Lotus japonicus]|uniref:secreted RxLR effector protein 161-like n=1 Tax=Lotus japonicus TaxID=34305 RepID=UPI00258D2903|nr:secreted RxLR effector protein 161-like [Lotus japonicus]